MKILALDVGDIWTGTAISDPLGITARPYKTVKQHDLVTFLRDLFEQESIATVIIGYPLTMRGTHSQQTDKVLAVHQELMKRFPTITFKLFDERLTSQQAAHLKKATSKEDKIASHSVAAAVILSTYLIMHTNS